VHSGRRVRLTVRPAPADSGLVFVRTDVHDQPNRISVSPEAVTRTQLNTEISNAEGVSVSTIEHLMAAFSGLGIDNAVIELDGPEVPIMDGSAFPFVQIIDRAGRRPLGKARNYIEVLAPVEVTLGDKRAALMPIANGAGLEMAFEIAFTSKAVGRQAIDLAVDETSFREELAAARTFGSVQEVEALRAAGLARGGSLENAIVLDGDRILNPEGLRFPDEFVRHKAMDAVGDLYVLGAPVLGRFEARYSGHALNNALVRELWARPEAWRYASVSEALAEAG
jgi:UDP-3-O-[3-hydroxymyristoyl] N-acetylglucosamine deacetylase